MLPHDSEYGNHEQISSRDRTLGIDVHACKPPKGAQDIMIFAMCAIQAVLFVTEATDRPSPRRGRKNLAHGASHGTARNKRSTQPRRGERPDLLPRLAQTSPLDVCGLRPARHLIIQRKEVRKHSRRRKVWVTCGQTCANINVGAVQKGSTEYSKRECGLIGNGGLKRTNEKWTARRIPPNI